MYIYNSDYIFTYAIIHIHVQYKGIMAYLLWSKWHIHVILQVHLVAMLCVCVCDQQSCQGVYKGVRAV